MAKATKKMQKRRRPSLQSIYIHHIAWGVVCLVMFGLLITVWSMNQTANQKSIALEKRLSQMAEPACSARDTWGANTTKNFTLKVGDKDRSYRVHLPERFSATEYYPVVLYFTGKGTGSVDGERLANLNKLPAIAIYPQASTGKDGYFAWQGAPYSSGDDDVAFVDAMLDRVHSQLCVQRSHVYATGYSNGGGIVSLLSCKLPDRFAAFGIVAGAMYYPAGDCTPERPTPLINIHGDNDPIVPYKGSIVRKLPAIDSWVTERARDNGCALQPSITYQGNGTYVTTWQFCRNGATVQNIRIQGGGHAWITDAPDTLWRFMTQYSL